MLRKVIINILVGLSKHQNFTPASFVLFLNELGFAVLKGEISFERKSNGIYYFLCGSGNNNAADNIREDKQFQRSVNRIRYLRVSHSVTFFEGALWEEINELIMMEDCIEMTCHLQYCESCQSDPASLLSVLGCNIYDEHDFESAENPSCEEHSQTQTM